MVTVAFGWLPNTRMPPPSLAVIPVSRPLVNVVCGRSAAQPANPRQSRVQAGTTNLARRTGETETIVSFMMLSSILGTDSHNRVGKSAPDVETTHAVELAWCVDRSIGIEKLGGVGLPLAPALLGIALSG